MKTRTASLVWLLCLAAMIGRPTPAAAQATIRGHVVQEDGSDPVPNAVVSIEVLNLRAVSNAQGFYKLEIPAGTPAPPTIRVLASATGFAAESADVNLAPGMTTLNFSLSLAFQDQVTVGGTEPLQEHPTQLPQLVISDFGESGMDAVLEERKPMKGKLHLRIGIQTVHDDNLFQYSNESRRRFDPRTSRFLGLQAIDDYALAIPARVDYRPPFLSRPRFVVVADPQFYRMNPQRNYVLCSFAVEQSLPKDTKASFRYLLIPYYFLRRLALPPNQRRTYADAEYRMMVYEASLQATLSDRFTTEVSVEFGNKNYNSEFPYMDSSSAAVGAEVLGKLSKSFRLEGGVGYERSIASGRDTPKTNYDNSYGWWSFYAQPKVDIRKRFHFSGKVTYGPRIFFSDLPEDINHFGRRDATWSEELSFRLDLNSDFEFRTKYERTDRSSNRNGVELEFPSFQQNTFTLGIFYEY